MLGSSAISIEKYAIVGGFRRGFIASGLPFSRPLVSTGPREREKAFFPLVRHATWNFESGARARGGDCEIIIDDEVDDRTPGETFVRS
jgi:hypothetical protein